MASARQKTPKRLMEKLQREVMRISADESAIMKMDDSGEILAEYKEHLDLASALSTVKRRHERIKEELSALKNRESIEKEETEAVKRVEAVAPPEPVVTVTFRVTATKSKLVALREYMRSNGIKYE